MFVLAGVVSLGGLYVSSAFGLSLLAAGVVLIFYAVARPKGAIRGAGVLVAGILVLGVATSAGFGVAVPNTTLTFTATRAQVPQHSFVLSATTGGGGINVSYSTDNSIAYRVTFRYPSGRSAFPSLTIVPRLRNSTSDDVFYLNLNGAGARIDVVLGKGYAYNVSLRAGAGNVVFTQGIGQQVRRLDCASDAGNTAVLVFSVPVVTCRTGAGNINASIRLSSASGTAALTASAGNVHLDLQADLGVGVWLRGESSLGNVVPRGVEGMNISSQSVALFEAQTADYSNLAYQYQVTCSTSLGNIDITFAVLPSPA